MHREAMTGRVQQSFDETLGLATVDRALIVHSADGLEASFYDGEIAPDAVAKAWADGAESGLRHLEAGSFKATRADNVHRQHRAKVGLGR